MFSRAVKRFLVGFGNASFILLHPSCSYTILVRDFDWGIAKLLPKLKFLGDGQCLISIIVVVSIPVMIVLLLIYFSQLL